MSNNWSESNLYDYRGSFTLGWKNRMEYWENKEESDNFWTQNDKRILGDYIHYCELEAEKEIIEEKAFHLAIESIKELSNHFDNGNIHKNEFVFYVNAWIKYL